MLHVLCWLQKDVLVVVVVVAVVVVVVVIVVALLSGSWQKGAGVRRIDQNGLQPVCWYGPVCTTAQENLHLRFINFKQYTLFSHA